MNQHYVQIQERKPNVGINKRGQYIDNCEGREGSYCPRGIKHQSQNRTKTCRIVALFAVLFWKNKQLIKKLEYPKVLAAEVSQDRTSSNFDQKSAITDFSIFS